MEWRNGEEELKNTKLKSLSFWIEEGRRERSEDTRTTLEERSDEGLWSLSGCAKSRSESHMKMYKIDQERINNNETHTTRIGGGTVTSQW